MDFPEADLTEPEEIDQVLQDIEDGCCVGEFTETGEVRLERQTLFGRDDLPCSDIDTELLDRLIRNELVTFNEEPHPTLNDTRRRIYKVNRDKQRGKSMTVNEQLEKLADDEGETTICPDGKDELSMKAFQGEVRRLRALADEGVIGIVRQPRQESYTGKRYIDRVRVRLTASGDELREALHR